MFDALDITEDEARGLSELAATDLAMAKRFAARAQAAEDPDEANEFARSYQRMARSYRQTLALKLRLKRECERAAREAAEWEDENGADWAPPSGLDKETEARLHRRKLAVRAAVTRVIWDEAEPSEVERLLDHLEDDVEPVSGPRPGVLFTPQDEHAAQLVARMRDRLAAWRARACAPATPDTFDPEPDPPDPAASLRRASG